MTAADPTDQRQGPQFCSMRVPLFSQANNASGEGWRECFSSSLAMVASYWGKVRSDDEYNRIRARYGDTTSTAAQVQAIEALGLVARFRLDMDRTSLIAELRSGRPCAVGWLHHGPVTQPSGGGHWIVARGIEARGILVNDPWGEADLVAGGYVTSGSAWSGCYSWRNWLPRWDVRAHLPGGGLAGPSGWAVTVAPRGRDGR